MVGGKDFIEVRGTTSDKSLPLYFTVTVSVTCYLQVSPENCQPFPRTVTPRRFHGSPIPVFFRVCPENPERRSDGRVRAMRREARRGRRGVAGLKGRRMVIPILSASHRGHQ
jgi:hypothetical protein